MLSEQYLSMSSYYRDIVLVCRSCYRDDLS